MDLYSLLLRALLKCLSLYQSQCGTVDVRVSCLWSHKTQGRSKNQATSGISVEFSKWSLDPASSLLRIRRTEIHLVSTLSIAGIAL